MRALVLGGGGIAGIAWEAGVLQGLKDGGVDVGGWDLVIGTSAGSFVGARLLVNGGPERAFAEEIDAILADDELELTTLTGTLFVRSLRLGRRARLAWVPATWYLAVTMRSLVAHAARHGFRRTLDAWRTMRHPDFHPERVHRFGKAIGALAVLGRRGSDRALVRYLSRILGADAPWPATPFVTVAADVTSGQRVPLDAESGIPLVRAVAASMALPGFVVPMRDGKRRLMDGGVTTATSADLAGGFDHVLVIAPLVTPGVLAEIDALRHAGTHVDVIRPSARTAPLWWTLRMMDPKYRPDAALAGRDDGIEAARQLLAETDATDSPVAASA